MLKTLHFVDLNTMQALTQQVSQPTDSLCQVKKNIVKQQDHFIEQ